MNPTRRRACLALATLPAIVAAPSLVRAETYPSRPVRIIVAYPPGQSTDIATRYFANQLSIAFGQQFFVENRAGAFGNIGTAFAARQVADGYNLIMAASGTHAMNPFLYSNIGFDADKDFDPIAATAMIPMVITVNPSLGVKTLDELMRMARERPDKIDVALPSVAAQLVYEMLRQRGVPLFGVKYKGSGDSMTALLGNHVPVLIDTVAASRAHFGKVIPLAVTSPKAMGAFPELRSLDQQGMPVVVTAWNALMAPTGTPLAMRERLAV